MPSLFLPILTICAALSQAPAHHLDPKVGIAWPGHSDSACWQVVPIPVGGGGVLDLDGCLSLAAHINKIPDAPGITSRMTCAMVAGEKEESQPPAEGDSTPEPRTPPSHGGKPSQDQQL